MSTVTKLTTIETSKTLPLIARGGAPHSIGDRVSQIGSQSLVEDPAAGARIGVWESTPGRWPRQQTAAEFCLILSGRCSFAPDNGAEIDMTAGDVVYFPANSQGVWSISETVRKIYVLV
jgi:uncharacterized protein